MFWHDTWFWQFQEYLPIFFVVTQQSNKIIIILKSSVIIFEPPMCFACEQAPAAVKQMTSYEMKDIWPSLFSFFLALWFFLSSNKIEALSTRWPSSEECPSAGLQIWLTSLHQVWIIRIWLHFIRLRKCFVSWPATETTIKKSVVWSFHNLFLTLFAWLYFVSISLFKWAAVKVNDALLEPVKDVGKRFLVRQTYIFLGVGIKTKTLITLD